MEFKDINIKRVLIFLLVFLSILFLANYVYRVYYIEKPLKEFYENSSIVKSYEIINKNNIKEINLTLKQVDNLKDAYNSLLVGTEKVLNNKKFIIKLENDKNADEKLNEFYYKIQFIVYEAIQKGEFLKMSQYIMAESQRNNINSKLYIDEKNLYIQLNDEDKYLYKIISRTDTPYWAANITERGNKND